jgi:hypothetical protein
MIDVDAEKLVPLSEARKLLPRRRGKLLTWQCLYKWSRVGCAGERLETVSVGHTIHTSKQAIGRFIERVSKARGLS